MEQTDQQAELAQAKQELDEATDAMIEAMRLHSKALRRWMALQDQETRREIETLSLETATAGGLQ